MAKKELKVVELFAGVGGFRIGFDRVKSKTYKYSTVWNNQWEPSRTKQHASEIYVRQFGDEGHSNKDIAEVPTSEIPDHDVLVGGFPCQDYSVARTASQATGIKGKKGVLWWEIYRILKEKGAKRPQLLILENVDRLLKSPSTQRGRDFAIMLSSLARLDYAVEWRVINAADYGMPQRRRRVYIIGYKKGSKLHKELKKNKPNEWLAKSGITAQAFKIIKPDNVEEFEISDNLVSLTENFNLGGKKSLFETGGMMIDWKVWTFKAEPKRLKEKTLGEVIIKDDEKIYPKFFIPEKGLKSWMYHKGAKSEERVTKSGFKYNYTEGGMIFPDQLDKPSRTIVTGEGGSTPSRFKHVIKTPSGKYRRLTPVELERLNMFPDNHTQDVSDNTRAFLMGNALVIGIVTRLGTIIVKALDTK